MDTQPASSRPVVVEAEAARRFAAGLLETHAVPPDDARIIAGCLVRADLRGVESHGITRLPGYLDRLRRGLIEPRPDLVVESVTPVAAALDGRNGFGFVIATRAMAAAIDMAAVNGIGIVSARHSTHFGMAACYVLQAVEAGYIAQVFTNASPGMPPWGGRAPLIGTSPLAFGAPGGALGPYILDMSPAVAARGRIRRAVRAGTAIPEGWALDADGVPTTDPIAALEGVMLPIGGPKGSGLSMLMDIFGGVLSGAAFGGGVGDMTRDFDRPQDVGHFFLAMRPDLFVAGDAYRDRMDELIRRIHEAPRAAGFDEIVIPGELEARTEAQRGRDGIPYERPDLVALDREAERAGLPPLAATG